MWKRWGSTLNTIFTSKHGGSSKPSSPTDAVRLPVSGYSFNTYFHCPGFVDFVGLLVGRYRRDLACMAVVLVIPRIDETLGDSRSSENPRDSSSSSWIRRLHHLAI